MTTLMLWVGRRVPPVRGGVLLHIVIALHITHTKHLIHGQHIALITLQLRLLSHTLYILSSALCLGEFV